MTWLATSPVGTGTVKVVRSPHISTHAEGVTRGRRFTWGALLVEGFARGGRCSWGALHVESVVRGGCCSWKALLVEGVARGRRCTWGALLVDGVGGASYRSHRVFPTKVTGYPLHKSPGFVTDPHTQVTGYPPTQVTAEGVTPLHTHAEGVTRCGWLRRPWVLAP